VSPGRRCQDRPFRSFFPLIKGSVADFATPRLQSHPAPSPSSGKNLSLTGIIRLALADFLAVLRAFSRLDKSERSLSSADPGRTRDRGHQASVRLRQGALSRAEQEPPSPAGHLRDGQSVHGAPPSIALPVGVMCPQSGRQTLQTSQCGINTAQHRVSPPMIESPCPNPNRRPACSDVPSAYAPLFGSEMGLPRQGLRCHS